MSMVTKHRRSKFKSLVTPLINSLFIFPSTAGDKGVNVGITGGGGFKAGFNGLSDNVMTSVGESYGM